MDIGVGLDSSLNLSLDEQAQLSVEAARLGYTSIWTPEGTGQDSFQLCSLRWEASRKVVPGGLAIGISVSPVMYRTPMAFAMSGGTLSQRTGGKFFMGIGTGGAYRPRSRRALGMRGFSALALMRDYLAIIRKLVAGEEVNYQGEVVTLQDAKLAIDPPPNTPLYLGAMGPEMLRLAGELADGACLNWCNPERIAWSRKRIAEGAAKANRDPSQIKMVQYIRVCVDDDVDVARLAYAKATMGYALGDHIPTERERQLGYRAHFERMGHSEELAKLDQMRENGASEDEVATTFSDKLLNDVGYYGSAVGAAPAFKRVSHGLDTAVVRVVASRPGLEPILAVMRACRPELVQ